MTRRIEMHFECDRCQDQAATLVECDDRGRVEDDAIPESWTERGVFGSRRLLLLCPKCSAAEL